MSRKGEILISRVYRDDVNRQIAAAFKSYILDTKEIRTPIRYMAGATFFHIKVGEIFVTAIARKNVNAALVFELLYKIVDTFQSYFNEITEDSIHKNFVLIYELLDEILDFGHPQLSSREVLQSIITQGKARFDSSKGKSGLAVTKQVTGAVPWRSPDITYKKNQVFIDVIETVNVLISSRGAVLNADTSGKLQIKSELSGMPTCIVGLNDKAYALASEARARGIAGPRRAGGIAIDAFTFHQCVSLDKFDAEHKISFIPPDGTFDMMKYRASEKISLPFRVHHNIQESADHIDVHLTVKSTFTRETFANNFKVKIPVPPNTAVCKVRVGVGKAKYLPESSCILWKLWRFPGQSESTLAADIALIHMTGDKQTWERPPISFDFEVPMFTSSGLVIKYMKVVEKSHYQAVKWVRYVTKAGSYQYRM